MESMIDCPICMGPAKDGVNCCGDKQHELICKECLVAYIENAVNTSFFGACPSMICPSISHHTKKKRKVLIFDEWKSLVSANVTSKYSSLAHSLSAFLCGGCHALKSLDVGSDTDKTSTNYVYLAKWLSPSTGNGTFEEFECDLNSFIAGDLVVESFYTSITSKYFPNLLAVSDPEAWEVFVNVLRVVRDPERRANLHLRYLRDRPRIKTLCCSREHCFKCKTKDFHEGKSCVENSASLDHSVVCCPTCGISLAKGDGCNTITCVCGKQFSWSAEKENTERCQQFLEAFPEGTSAQCAQLLFVPPGNPAQLLQAKAWQIRHRVEVNRALLARFRAAYWPCPSQCCVVLPLDRLPDGVREAADLWRGEHKQAVEKCRRDTDIARRAIFLAMYPHEADWPCAAFSLLNLPRKVTRPGHARDQELVGLAASAGLWAESHRDEFRAGVEQMEVRSAKQFLLLYGSRPVQSTRPSSVNSPCSLEWDRAASNSDLTYTNDNTSVERVGSVSCYPAAFAALASERSMFRVVVEAAPKSSNWLTFGVARQGMASSSSDGVGRTNNSWGLSDDRSASSGNAILASSGTEVGSFRKLRVGDELSAVVDTAEGWMELAVNDQELFYRFEIPPGAPSDYCFAMTFANDHRVSIVCDYDASRRAGVAEAAPMRGVLNADHTRMYHSLRKHVKMLVAEESDPLSAAPHIAHSTVACSPLKVSGEQWLARCGGTVAAAEEAYRVMLPEINAFVNIKTASTQAAGGAASSSPSGAAREPTWSELLEAVSWFHENRERLALQTMVDVATNFYGLHGDDAPFIAAMNLAQFHTHRVEREEVAASLAFMRVFPDLAHDWYDYDRDAPEPVIENVARDCRCLPRHTKTCPTPGAGVP